MPPTVDKTTVLAAHPDILPPSIPSIDSASPKAAIPLYEPKHGPDLTVTFEAARHRVEGRCIFWSLEMGVPEPGVKSPPVYFAKIKHGDWRGTVASGPTPGSALVAMLAEAERRIERENRRAGGM